jgi:hypothetical protein
MLLRGESKSQHVPRKQVAIFKWTSISQRYILLISLIVFFKVSMLLRGESKSQQVGG